MIYLYDQSTGTLVGEITEVQLQFMIDQMEEESLEDKDYSITNMEIDYFTEQGADPDLIALLRKALGSKGEVIIRWSRSQK